MSLLDASGRPTQSNKLKDEDIIRILSNQKGKVDQLNMQLIQLGLFSEYLAEEMGRNLKLLAEQTGLDLGINMENFETFASQRFEEIRRDAVQALAGSQPASASPAIDLSEDS